MHVSRNFESRQNGNEIISVGSSVRQTARLEWGCASGADPIWIRRYMQVKGLASGLDGGAPLLSVIYQVFKHSIAGLKQLQKAAAAIMPIPQFFPN